MARITVVNDNAEFLELMHDILEGERYDTVLIDGDRPTALEEIRASGPDMLIIDVRLGVQGDHGWEIAMAVRDDPAFTELPVLLCCTDPQGIEELAEKISEARGVEILAKPFSIDQLTDAIDRLMGQNAAT